jgi:hypothetical protein
MHKNRNLQRKNAVYHSPKKKWQRAVSSIQEARRNDPALYNTFQRDLSKGIDYFRDRRHSVIESPATFLSILIYIINNTDNCDVG